jgi:hypothetical protein
VAWIGLRGGRSRFLFKAFYRVRISRYFIGKKLQRYLAPQL